METGINSGARDGVEAATTMWRTGCSPWYSEFGTTLCAGQQARVAGDVDRGAGAMADGTDDEITFWSVNGQKLAT